MISEQLLALKEATYPHLNPALAEQARFVQEDVVGCCQRSRHRRADFGVVFPQNCAPSMQTATEPLPSFEVASIKPSRPGEIEVGK